MCDTRNCDYLTHTIASVAVEVGFITVSGPGYFTPTFSIMHNFCSRLSIEVKQTVNKTLIPCYFSAVQICVKIFIYNHKFCVQIL